MTNWPLNPQHAAFESGGLNAATTNSSVTLNATVNHTKTGWSQLIAATAEDSHGFLLSVSCPNGFSALHLVDIGIGGAGSEVVILGNHFFDGRRLSGSGGYEQYFIPLFIPAGSRVAARYQTNLNAEDLNVIVQLMAGDFLLPQAYQKIETIGADTATSRGTDVDPGATANTKGAWSQLIASSAGDWAGFYLVIGWSDNSAVGVHTRFMIDVGVGAAASEVVLLPDWFANVEIVGDRQVVKQSPVFFIPIPAGARVAVRAQSNNTDATDRIFDLAIYGLVI